MESESWSGGREELDMLKRAEVLTHTRYPKLGSWYPPLSGLLGAIFVAGYAVPIWLSLIIWVGVMAVAGACAAWYLRKRGVMPDVRRTPGALRRESMIFFGAYLLAIAIIIGCYLAVNWMAGSVAAFVLLTALIAIYEARFFRAARQVEVDAGIIGEVEAS